MRRLTPSRRWHELGDAQQYALLAVVAALLSLAGLLIETAEWEPFTRQPDLLGIALMVICGGSLAIALRYPLIAGALSAGSCSLALALGYSVWISSLVSAVIVGVCAAHTSRRSTLVLGAVVIAMAIWVVIEEGEVAPGELLGSVALAAIPVAVGDLFRVRRELAAEAEERAERLGQLRELELARAVDTERLRIARDVHDVVGHHLSAIAIQAGVGETLAADGDEEGARRALATIRNVTATALAETRRLLGLVRNEGERRALGLSDPGEIEDLARQAEQGGLSVTVRQVGEQRPLGGVLGDCAYRIVQEALTNVSRHAAAEHAVVELRYGEAGLELVIEDDGVGGGQGSGGGHGLIGMRERVAVVGGELAAGPLAGRGWRVRASLPYEEAPES